MLPASLPRARLGVVPSPLEDHPALAARLGVESLLIKRDDLNGPDFGGNKRRALEYLLADGEFLPVSMGGFGSTWCAALALLAAGLDRPAYLALFPQPWTGGVAGLLSTTLTHARVEIASSRWAVPAALWRTLRRAVGHGRARWIPAGGASPLGVLGSVNGALELVRQVEEQGLERPEAVLVPLGSGGTAAGLVLGFRLAGWSVQVIGVRVADAWVANRWQVGRLQRATERVLRRHGLRIPDGSASLVVAGSQFGAGYGHATDSARAAQALFGASGVALDLTYGAKAAAAIQEMGNRFRRLCFWHTFDARLMSDPLSGHPLFQRAQACAESLWRHSKST